MIAVAKELHIVIGEKLDGSRGMYIGDEGTAADKFKSWSSLADTTDLDGDSDVTESQFKYLLWYGKGRLIKYRNLTT